MYQRIISIVPSQTELLFDLGLGERIIAVTKYCIYPAQALDKTKIGGTKTLDIQAIIDLKPDLILGNIEENQKEQIEILRLTQNVVMTDIYTLNDALQMIQEVGTLTDSSEKANAIVADISQQFADLWQHIAQKNSTTVAPKVAYFIWRKPYMVAAENTFIADMLSQIGFENAFANKTRYPIIQDSGLVAAQPDYIFLSSEPFPFKEKHVAELQQICPNAIVKIVDGEPFSWYGSRLLSAPAYFKTLL
jgi:ABC-type Fe3+-hydroxamate transport system substrate-binding protein